MAVIRRAIRVQLYEAGIVESVGPWLAVEEKPVKVSEQRYIKLFQNYENWWIGNWHIARDTLIAIAHCDTCVVLHLLISFFYPVDNQYYFL